MKKNSPLNEDEIDLIVLFKIIWDSKMKILLITIISFLIGLAYNSQIPRNYLNTLTINPNKTSEFVKLDILQKLARLNQSSQSSLPNELNQLNQPNQLNQLSKLNLARFIVALEDYEEFLLSFKNIKKIQEIEEIELFKYAKLLEIVKPKKNEENYIINFKWHDPDEAKKILQDTLNLTSKNLKRLIDMELSQFLEFEKKLVLNRDAKRLVYLNEQSAIAKELNIAENQANNVYLSDSRRSLNFSTVNIAYYLRGHKAIEKEIELIKNRVYQDLKFIEQEINDFKNEEIKFAKYNVFLMDHNLIKNTTLILVISILLGLIIGIFYVLISNAIQSQTASRK